MGLNPLSTVLVGLQFILIGLMVWPFGPWRLSMTFWSAIVASAVLGVFTLAHNRLGNFNIRPEPKASAKLITSGSYRLIRHPMYSALMLAMAAFVVAEQSSLKLGLWFALALVLTAKANFEEQLMRERFQEYENYQERTKRFVPWLW